MICWMGALASEILVATSPGIVCNGSLDFEDLEVKR